MQTFTGWQYLLIDVANQWGLDKELFETRIAWAEQNLPQLESLADDRGHWKERPLYLKACMAIRDAQRGYKSGHMVGFDSVNSGMQIMSVLTGCKSGAEATGLVNPNERADAYTKLTKIMSQILGYDYSSERSKVKDACMTSLYGSKKQPVNLFGENTPEYDAFIKAMIQMAPGACELLGDLIDSWQAAAKDHSWSLPDGYEAFVRVMVKKTERINIDELQSSFTYTYYENEGTNKGLSNAANVIHSVDAYILRSLIRRCSYDPAVINSAYNAITAEILERTLGESIAADSKTNEIDFYCNLYQSTGMVDPVILNYLDHGQTHYLSNNHLHGLALMCKSMLEHKPFDIISIHDDFK